MIGRSPQCDIAINHASLGRNHARIQFVDDQFLLVDLGAGVGTFVNGQSAQSTQLANGDLLRVGEAVFRFEREISATSQQTLPWIE
jgi:pSer/pThr/pTyr-binding forkhead associated (FHA) protein